MTSLLDRYSVEELHEIVDLATPSELAIIHGALEAELHDWTQWARPNQLPPDGEWIIWLLVTGRRWGKTRTAAEWLRVKALERVGAYGICAPTYGDARDICVEQGTRADPSGFLSVCATGEVQNYNRSIGEIRMSNGSRIKMLSADEPDRARGWGFRSVWCDEFASWKRPATWYETLLPATTMADYHRFVITTTPKRNDLTRAIVAEAHGDPERVRLVRGQTIENAANLGAGAVDDLRRRMSARLARQELEGELLEDIEGALWSEALIERDRLPHDTEPDFQARSSRIVVAVDPAVTAGEDSDETGIVVAGRIGEEAYVLDDASGQWPAVEAMVKAVDAFEFYEANAVVIETNNGGDYLASLLHTVKAGVAVTKVTATRGKALRAEPIVGLYERGLVHHIGHFPELEDQMTAWVPGDRGRSPDRLDALVWALTALFPELEAGEGRKLSYRGAA